MALLMQHVVLPVRRSGTATCCTPAPAAGSPKGTKRRHTDSLPDCLSRYARPALSSPPPTARVCAAQDGHQGPLLPRHIRRAYQMLGAQGRLPGRRGQAKKAFR